MTVEFTFRPIDVWPGELRARRDRSPFRASYTDTLELLQVELRHLKARRCVIQLALREGDIRLDGLPRADARPPSHPGVIIAFDSKHGPLKYATDQYDGRGPEGWKANLRAIALGLQALRAVDRYGITRKGEQYTGWKAIESGRAMGAGMSVEEAAAFLAEQACIATGEPTQCNAADVMTDRGAWAYRTAAKVLHPDAGGDPALFGRLTDARRVLETSAS